METENAELRKRLGEGVTPIGKKPTAMQNLSLQEKVDLFRSLFKGREDVFARRWYSKASGKAGYQPVCQNEWTSLCDKRTFKCADCPNRQFSPLTDNDVYRHLEGKDADVWIFFEVPVLAVKLREAQNLIRQCRKQLSDADEQVRQILDAPSVATNASP